MMALLALLACTTDLAVGLDAEHNSSAREDRALGAMAAATAQLGLLSFDVGPSLGRDLSLHSDAPVGPLKLAVAAACGVGLGPWAASVAAVLENSAPRFDLAVDVRHQDVALGLQVESVALAPQVRFLVTRTLGV